MYEYAVRFQKTGGPVVFVSWVKELKDLCEIDFAATMAQRGQGIAYLTDGQEAVKTSEAPAFGAEEVVAMHRPSLFHRGIKKAFRIGVSQTARLSPRLSEQLERRTLMLKMRRYKRYAPQKSDRLFIPWGEWWDLNFLAKLKGLKTEGVHLVPVIHDIGPIVMPQLSGHSTKSLTDYCTQIVPISALVLTVSQNTKKDLTAWLREQKLPVPRMEVIRLGDDAQDYKPMVPKEPVFAQSGLKGGDFILCVGTIEAKKNHALLWYAYNLAASRGVQLPKLVVAGRPGWKTENIIGIMREDPEGRFVLLHDASDQELAWLFDNCLFTILPSYYEGWGIPIAESLSRGVPCLCAKTSSMVEIAPGITEHFDPSSSDECLASIQRWLDPATFGTARAKTRQYKLHTWDDSFKRMSTYLKELK